MAAINATAAYKRPSAAARLKPRARLPFTDFTLFYRHELFDETGTVGSLPRLGIVTDRLGGKNLSRRAFTNVGGAISQTLKCKKSILKKP
jgi:hypothetical protein